VAIFALNLHTRATNQPHSTSTGGR
jgi:hypothetical protein